MRSTLAATDEAAHGPRDRGASSLLRRRRAGPGPPTAPRAMTSFGEDGTSGLCSKGCGVPRWQKSVAGSRVYVYSEHTRICSSSCSNCKGLTHDGTSLNLCSDELSSQCVVLVVDLHPPAVSFCSGVEIGR